MEHDDAALRRAAVDDPAGLARFYGAHAAVVAVLGANHPD